jgi:hypothetical protein
MAIRGASMALSLLTAMALLASSAGADEIDLKTEGAIEQRGITIIGDQELPKVLYIVPWVLPEPPAPVEPFSRPAYLAPMSPCDLDSQEVSEPNMTSWTCPPSS